MGRSEQMATKANKGKMLVRLAASVLVLGLALLLPQSTQAIDKGDHLKYGQDLVDKATVEIDKRIDTLRGGSMDCEVVYSGLNSLISWWDGYRRDEVAERYYLDEPVGLLILDGVADTLATRISPLLEIYAQRNPEENLSRGRQTLEMLLAHPSYQPPTGRFIGYYLEGFSFLYFAQAETLLVQLNKEDRVRTDLTESIRGVYDGVLRHVLSLIRLYDQVHITDADKYFCRLDQEDSIPPRSKCTKCGQQGLKVTNVMNGLNESETPECAEVELRKLGNGVEGINARFNCKHYGHIFDLECEACSEKFHYSVPLPYFKKMQRDIATGKEKAPDITPLIKEM